MPLIQAIRRRTIHCYYCGIICVGVGTRDHVYPRSKGGVFGPRGENRVFACRGCNQAKGVLTLEDFKKTEYYEINCRSGRWRGVRLYSNGSVDLILLIPACDGFRRSGYR